MLKFGNNKTVKDYAIFLATILVAIIFSNWGFKELLFGEERCCENYGQLHHVFYFQPFFSIFVSKFIDNALGTAGLVLIGQVILPASIFYMIAIIFNRYLNKIWSITIGFVSIFSFSDYAFRDFLVSIIKGTSISNVSKSLPEIANFPIPSLSILLFLIVFYHSTKLIKLDNKRISILTALWALQVYVNAIDALFGVCFWFSYFIIKAYKRNHDDNIKNLIKLTCRQAIISLIIWLPALFFVNFSSGEISISENFNIFTYYFLYMLLPIAMMVVLFVIHKIDSYEIFYKFWPIYILMALEFILVTTAFFFGKGINLEILTSRIPLFFLHFYYYLPIIFYASRQYYSYNIGKDGSRARNELRKMIFIIFNKLNYIYLPLIIVLVILFALISSNNFIS